MSLPIEVRDSFFKDLLIDINLEINMDNIQVYLHGNTKRNKGSYDTFVNKKIIQSADFISVTFLFTVRKNYIKIDMFL